jgi:uncharacterized protein (DUF736 family)
MAQIGAFTRTQSGYSGHVRTLTLDIALFFVSADNADADNAPDYRIHLGDEEGPQIGAGWKRTSEKAGEFVALVVDDPAFPEPLRAHLFRSGDNSTAWALHWIRLSKRSERG